MILETLYQLICGIFKRKKLNVLISDEFVKMENIINKKELIKKSDIIILGAPHSSYKKLKIQKISF